MGSYESAFTDGSDEVGNPVDLGEGGHTVLTREEAEVFDEAAPGPVAEVEPLRGHSPLSPEEESLIKAEIDTTVERIWGSITKHTVDTEDGPRMSFPSRGLLDFLLEGEIITQEMRDTQIVEPAAVVAGIMMREESGSPTASAKLHGKKSHFTVMALARQAVEYKRKGEGLDAET